MLNALIGRGTNVKADAELHHAEVTELAMIVETRDATR